jgi:hypothetical protein
MGTGGYEVHRGDEWLKRFNGKPPDAAPLLVPQAKFLEGFSPPDYLVDGVLQRRFLYSLTGVTGGGKTAIGLLLARAVGCVAPDAMSADRLSRKGMSSISLARTLTTCARA